ncbi:hypothetical protein BD414DRAFT_567570 [Trametes punicea]|nr:hypothetical protein BD414DRAFT_567570 [Trametes punicea]
MKIAASVLAVVLATSSAVALPRETVSAQERCRSSVGDHAVANFGPFTLAAVNKTLGMHSNQSEPLELSPSVTNSSATQYRSLATNNTYPYVEFVAFTLTDGGLIGVNNASSGLGAEALAPQEAKPFTFKVSHTALHPEPVFCGVVGKSTNSSKPAVLALHGDTESFSICRSEFKSNGTTTPLDVVVYKARANDHDLYNFRSCYSVYIQLVPTASASG